MNTPAPAWIEDLKAISARINEALNSETFTRGVRPNYLSAWTKAYPLAGGKRLRPALVYWCCGLLGGAVEKAHHAALAVELYHNWTLVHDDIIDNDNMRRGRPTVHCGVTDEKMKQGYPVSDSQMLGLSTAILAGDVLQGWAIRELCHLRDEEVHPNVVLRLVERMQDFLCRGLISGEALDVDMSVQNSTQITESAVLDMMVGKTGVLLGYCCEAGARIARHDLDEHSPEIQSLLDFANHLGIAFQLRDDWLGLFGSEQVLGKPIGSDLMNRKPTLFYIRTLAKLEGTNREDFYRLSGRTDLTAQEIKRATQMMVEVSVVKEVVSEMEHHAQVAIEILNTFPESIYREYLIALTQYAVTRNS